MTTQLKLEVLSSVMLLGISISNLETQSKTGDWNPALEIRIGLIFVSFVFIRYQP
tara:strand:- start:1118 stop:1282 length:165 start_codon:yes stop_codon:yes gene_type:complete